MFTDGLRCITKYLNFRTRKQQLCTRKVWLSQGSFAGAGSKDSSSSRGSRYSHRCHVAVGCSVLQWDVVLRGVLQWIVVWGCVLKCVKAVTRLVAFLC